MSQHIHLINPVDELQPVLVIAVLPFRNVTKTVCTNRGLIIYAHLVQNCFRARQVVNQLMRILLPLRLLVAL